MASVISRYVFGLKGNNVAHFQLQSYLNLWSIEDFFHILKLFLLKLQGTFHASNSFLHYKGSKGAIVIFAQWNVVIRSQMQKKTHRGSALWCGGGCRHHYAAAATSHH